MPDNRPTPERMERCDCCRWWEAINLPIGTCHRHAPRPSEAHPTHWPRTMADEWCGEFEPWILGTFKRGLQRMVSRRNPLNFGL